MSKIGPPLKIRTPAPFFEWSVAKAAFLSKVHPPIYMYATVHLVKLIKKHWRSSIVQEEGLTNKGRHHLLLLHKQAHDKRGIAELQHVYINRAKLIASWDGRIFEIQSLAVGIITPAPCFYLPIGRGGQRIRELEDASGARIKVHVTYLLCSKS